MFPHLGKYQLRNKDIDFRNNSDPSNQRRLQCLPHLHRELELICMMEGETTVCVDSTRHTLRAGDVFLSFPNQIHSYESHGHERFYIFIIKPDLMPDLMETFTTGVPTTPIIQGAANRVHIRRLFDSLAETCTDESADRSYTNTLRRGYLLALFSELLSMMSITRLSVSDCGALRSIVAFCDKNYSENLSLSLLEEKLHLNKYYISHLFSEKLGLRFNDYINSLRISEACRYLVHTDHSITEISEIVGFNTLRTFNRAFMKQLGISPSEYRKKDLSPSKAKQDDIPSTEASLTPPPQPIVPPTPVVPPISLFAENDDDPCAL